MLTELLQVKRLREQDAERAVKAAKNELMDAQRAVREAEEAVLRHHDFRLKEEKRLFQEIKGEAVTVARIDEMKLAVEEARDAVPPFEEALRDAESAHREAIKTTQKYEEFVAIEQKELAQAAATREEAEAEEISETGFAARSRGDA